MEMQIETAVELYQDVVDFRTLLDTEIFLIGGGEVAINVY